MSTQPLFLQRDRICRAQVSQHDAAGGDTAFGGKDLARFPAPGLLYADAALSQFGGHALQKFVLIIDFIFLQGHVVSV